MDRLPRLNVLTITLTLLLTVLLQPATTIAQTKPSDAEMKEVVRLLIEREVGRTTDTATVAILLGPNVKSSWIPEVSGFSIRKLTYEEQKRVPEYYDLSSSFKDNVVEVALTKGNYCRKAGRRYEFRRHNQAWQSKVIGYVQSTGGSGRCDGCAIESGAAYSVAAQFPSNDSATENQPARVDNLRLTGSVQKISCSKDADYVRCKAELSLKFTNTGNMSLIILQPHGDYEFWHGATTLALTEKASRANSFVYSVGAWPSFYQSPEYQNLAKLLDQPAPPEGSTRVLLPGASWNWDTSVMLSLQDGNSCNQHVGVEIGWEEIKRRPEPLWLRVSYEMWPFNVENFKRNLGGILKDRWQSHGVLYLEQKRGGFWQATLTSEPIELNLSQISLARVASPN